MIVDGTEVCFGKVVRLTLYYGKEQVVLLYAPNLNEMYNANIEVEVSDIANPMRKNNDIGFTANVTIKNPPEAAVQIIKDNTFFVARKDETEKETYERVKNNLQETLLEYYAHRPRCRVEVGYWDYSIPPEKADFKRDENGNKTSDEMLAPSHAIPNLTTLFDGYINSSALYHEGRDDILKFACHAYDAGLISTRAVMDEFMCHYPDLERQVKMEEQAQKDVPKRAATEDPTMWNTMFRKLVRNFAITKPDPYANYDVLTGQYNGGTKIIQESEREDGNWIRLYYIESPNNLEKKDEELRYRLERLNVYGFFTNAGTLADMLTDLCNERGAMVNWMQYDEYDTKHRTSCFFIWQRGKGLNSVDGWDADIKIINYQNLLESPSASTSGALHIKMFLNLDCIPLKRIALILDETQGSATGTGDSFVINPKGAFRESMAVHGQLNPYHGTRQLANSMNVYSQQLAVKDMVNRGYLFNTGFPIVKTKHHIETHGSAWETEVETIPMWQGLHVEV